MKKQQVKRLIEKRGLVGLRDLGLNDTAILIVGKLEEYFKMFPDGFHKHTEDREDQKELFGFSWVKELKISRPTFKKYFELVGAIYGSPEEFERNGFGDKPYCSILKRDNHKRTLYLRNHELADRFQRILNPDRNDLNMGMKE